jgi:hypothetical protein
MLVLLASMLFSMGSRVERYRGGSIVSHFLTIFMTAVVCMLELRIS